MLTNQYITRFQYICGTSKEGNRKGSFVLNLGKKKLFLYENSPVYSLPLILEN